MRRQPSEARVTGSSESNIAIKGGYYDRAGTVTITGAAEGTASDAGASSVVTPPACALFRFSSSTFSTSLSPSAFATGCEAPSRRLPAETQLARTSMSCRFGPKGLRGPKSPPPTSSTECRCVPFPARRRLNRRQAEPPASVSTNQSKREQKNVQRGSGELVTGQGTPAGGSRRRRLFELVCAHGPGGDRGRHGAPVGADPLPQELDPVALRRTGAGLLAGQ